MKVSLKDMLKNELIIIGSLKKNKRKVPSSFICTKNLPVFGLYFGFQKNGTLVSYKADKKNCIVIFNYA